MSKVMDNTHWRRWCSMFMMYLVISMSFAGITMAKETSGASEDEFVPEKIDDVTPANLHVIDVQQVYAQNPALLAEIIQRYGSQGTFPWSRFSPELIANNLGAIGTSAHLVARANGEAFQQALTSKFGITALVAIASGVMVTADGTLRNGVALINLQHIQTGSNIVRVDATQPNVIILVRGPGSSLRIGGGISGVIATPEGIFIDAAGQRLRVDAGARGGGISLVGGRYVLDEGTTVTANDITFTGEGTGDRRTAISITPTEIEVRNPATIQGRMEGRLADGTLTINFPQENEMIIDSRNGNSEIIINGQRFSGNYGARVANNKVQDFVLWNNNPGTYAEIAGLGRIRAERNADGTTKPLLAFVNYGDSGHPELIGAGGALQTEMQQLFSITRTRNDLRDHWEDGFRKADGTHVDCVNYDQCLAAFNDEYGRTITTRERAIGGLHRNMRDAANAWDIQGNDYDLAFFARVENADGTFGLGDFAILGGASLENDLGRLASYGSGLAFRSPANERAVYVSNPQNMRGNVAQVLWNTPVTDNEGHRIRIDPRTSIIYKLVDNQWQNINTGEVLSASEERNLVDLNLESRFMAGSQGEINQQLSTNSYLARALLGEETGRLAEGYAWEQGHTLRMFYANQRPGGNVLEINQVANDLLLQAGAAGTMDTMFRVNLGGGADLQGRIEEIRLQQRQAAGTIEAVEFTIRSRLEAQGLRGEALDVAIVAELQRAGIQRTDGGYRFVETGELITERVRGIAATQDQIIQTVRQSLSSGDEQRQFDLLTAGFVAAAAGETEQAAERFRQYIEAGGDLVYGANQLVHVEEDRNRVRQDLQGLLDQAQTDDQRVRLELLYAQANPDAQQSARELTELAQRYTGTAQQQQIDTALASTYARLATQHRGTSAYNDYLQQAETYTRQATQGMTPDQAAGLWTDYFNAQAAEGASPEERVAAFRQTQEFNNLPRQMQDAVIAEAYENAGDRTEDAAQRAAYYEQAIGMRTRNNADNDPNVHQSLGQTYLQRAAALGQDDPQREELLSRADQEFNRARQIIADDAARKNFDAEHGFNNDQFIAETNNALRGSVQAALTSGNANAIAAVGDLYLGGSRDWRDYGIISAVMQAHQQIGDSRAAGRLEGQLLQAASHGVHELTRASRERPLTDDEKQTLRDLRTIRNQITFARQSRQSQDIQQIQASLAHVERRVQELNEDIAVAHEQGDAAEEERLVAERNALQQDRRDLQETLVQEMADLRQYAQGDARQHLEAQILTIQTGMMQEYNQLAMMGGDDLLSSGDAARKALQLYEQLGGDVTIIPGVSATTTAYHDYVDMAARLFEEQYLREHPEQSQPRIDEAVRQYRRSLDLVGETTSLLSTEEGREQALQHIIQRNYEDKYRNQIAQLDTIHSQRESMRQEYERLDTSTEEGREREKELDAQRAALRRQEETIRDQFNENDPEYQAMKQRRDDLEQRLDDLRMQELMLQGRLGMGDSTLHAIVGVNSEAYMTYERAKQERANAEQELDTLTASMMQRSSFVLEWSDAERDLYAYNQRLTEQLRLDLQQGRVTEQQYQTRAQELDAAFKKEMRARDLEVAVSPSGETEAMRLEKSELALEQEDPILQTILLLAGGTVAGAIGKEVTRRITTTIAGELLQAGIGTVGRTLVTSGIGLTAEATAFTTWNRLVAPLQGQSLCPPGQGTCTFTGFAKEVGISMIGFGMDKVSSAGVAALLGRPGVAALRQASGAVQIATTVLGETVNLASFVGGNVAGRYLMEDGYTLTREALFEEIRTGIPTIIGLRMGGRLVGSYHPTETLVETNADYARHSLQTRWRERGLQRDGITLTADATDHSTAITQLRTAREGASPELLARVDQAIVDRALLANTEARYITNDEMARGNPQAMNDAARRRVETETTLYEAELEQRRNRGEQPDSADVEWLNRQLERAQAERDVLTNYGEMLTLTEQREATVDELVHTREEREQQDMSTPEGRERRTQLLEQEATLETRIEQQDTTLLEANQRQASARERHLTAELAVATILLERGEITPEQYQQTVNELEQQRLQNRGTGIVLEAQASQQQLLDQEITPEQASARAEGLELNLIETNLEMIRLQREALEQQRARGEVPQPFYENMNRVLDAREAALRTRERVIIARAEARAAPQDAARQTVLVAAERAATQLAVAVVTAEQQAGLLVPEEATARRTRLVESQLAREAIPQVEQQLVDSARLLEAHTEQQEQQAQEDAARLEDQGLDIDTAFDAARDTARTETPPELPPVVDPTAIEPPIEPPVDIKGVSLPEAIRTAAVAAEARVGEVEFGEPAAEPRPSDDLLIGEDSQSAKDLSRRLDLEQPLADNVDDALATVVNRLAALTGTKAYALGGLSLGDLAFVFSREGFKAINDKHGMEMGNRLIEEERVIFDRLAPEYGIDSLYRTYNTEARVARGAEVTVTPTLERVLRDAGRDARQGERITLTEKDAAAIAMDMSKRVETEVNAWLRGQGVREKVEITSGVSDRGGVEADFRATAAARMHTVEFRERDVLDRLRQARELLDSMDESLVETDAAGNRYLRTEIVEKVRKWNELSPIEKIRYAKAKTYLDAIRTLDYFQGISTDAATRQTTFERTRNAEAEIARVRAELAAGRIGDAEAREQLERINADIVRMMKHHLKNPNLASRGEWLLATVEPHGKGAAITERSMVMADLKGFAARNFKELESSARRILENGNIEGYGESALRETDAIMEQIQNDVLEGYVALVELAAAAGKINEAEKRAEIDNARRSISAGGDEILASVHPGLEGEFIALLHAVSQRHGLEIRAGTTRYLTGEVDSALRSLAEAERATAPAKSLEQQGIVIDRVENLGDGEHLAWIKGEAYELHQQPDETWRLGEKFEGDIGLRRSARVITEEAAMLERAERIIDPAQLDRLLEQPLAAVGRTRHFLELTRDALKNTPGVNQEMLTRVEHAISYLEAVERAIAAGGAERLVPENIEAMRETPESELRERVREEVEEVTEEMILEEQLLREGGILQPDAVAAGEIPVTTAEPRATPLTPEQAKALEVARGAWELAEPPENIEQVLEQFEEVPVDTSHPTAYRKSLERSLEQRLGYEEGELELRGRDITSIEGYQKDASYAIYRLVGDRRELVGYARIYRREVPQETRDNTLGGFAEIETLRRLEHGGVPDAPRLLLAGRVSHHEQPGQHLFVVEEAAPGKTYEDILRDIDPGNPETTSETAKRAAREIGKALARFHKSAESAPAESVEGKFLDDAELLESQTDEALRPNVQREANELPIPRGVMTHGDFRMQNVLYDSATGKATIIDFEFSQRTADADGRGVGHPAEDVAMFMESIRYISELRVELLELSPEAHEAAVRRITESLFEEFLLGYHEEAGSLVEGVAEALPFYQAQPLPRQAVVFGKRRPEQLLKPDGEGRQETQLVLERVKQRLTEEETARKQRIEGATKPVELTAKQREVVEEFRGVNPLEVPVEGRLEAILEAFPKAELDTTNNEAYLASIARMIEQKLGYPQRFLSIEIVKDLDILQFQDAIYRVQYDGQTIAYSRMYKREKTIGGLQEIDTLQRLEQQGMREAPRLLHVARGEHPREMGSHLLVVEEAMPGKTFDTILEEAVTAGEAAQEASLAATMTAARAVGRTLARFHQSAPSADPAVVGKRMTTERGVATHGDFHRGNALFDPQTGEAAIIDFEYAGKDITPDEKGVGHPGEDVDSFMDSVEMKIGLLLKERGLEGKTLEAETRKLALPIFEEFLTGYREEAGDRARDIETVAREYLGEAQETVAAEARAAPRVASPSAVETALQTRLVEASIAAAKVIEAQDGDPVRVDKVETKVEKMVYPEQEAHGWKTDESGEVIQREDGQFGSIEVHAEGNVVLRLNYFYEPGNYGESAARLAMDKQETSASTAGRVIESMEAALRDAGINDALVLPEGTREHSVWIDQGYRWAAQKADLPPHLQEQYGPLTWQGDGASSIQGKFMEWAQTAEGKRALERVEIDDPQRFLDETGNNPAKYPPEFLNSLHKRGTAPYVKALVVSGEVIPVGEEMVVSEQAIKDLPRFTPEEAQQDVVQMARGSMETTVEPQVLDVLITRFEEVDVDTSSKADYRKSLARSLEEKLGLEPGSLNVRTQKDTPGHDRIYRIEQHGQPIAYARVVRRAKGSSVQDNTMGGLREIDAILELKRAGFAEAPDVMFVGHVREVDGPHLLVVEEAASGRDYFSILQDTIESGRISAEGRLGAREIGRVLARYHKSTPPAPPEGVREHVQQDIALLSRQLLDTPGRQAVEARGQALPDARGVVTHGDFRTPNVLYDPVTGRATILDYEYSRRTVNEEGLGFGHPAEDVAMFMESVRAKVELELLAKGVTGDELAAKRDEIVNQLLEEFLTGYYQEADELAVGLEEALSLYRSQPNPRQVMGDNAFASLVKRRQELLSEAGEQQAARLVERARERVEIGELPTQEVPRAVAEFSEVSVGALDYIAQTLESIATLERDTGVDLDVRVDCPGLCAVKYDQAALDALPEEQQARARDVLTRLEDSLTQADAEDPIINVEASGEEMLQAARDAQEILPVIDETITKLAADLQAKDVKLGTDPEATLKSVLKLERSLEEEPGTVFVYHNTLIRNAERIAEEGLKPRTSNPDQYQDVIDEAAERSLPPELQGKGYRRATSLFAHPEEMASGIGGELRWGGVKLRIRVNLDEVIVSDTTMYSYAFSDSEIIVRESDREVSDAIDSYWSRMITLRELRDYYEVIELSDGPLYKLIPERVPPEKMGRLPKSIHSAEILIPTKISPADIQVVAFGKTIAEALPEGTKTIGEMVQKAMREGAVEKETTREIAHAQAELAEIPVDSLDPIARSLEDIATLERETGVDLDVKVDCPALCAVKYDEAAMDALPPEQQARARETIARLEADLARADAEDPIINVEASGEELAEVIDIQRERIQQEARVSGTRVPSHAELAEAFRDGRLSVDPNVYPNALVIRGGDEQAYRTYLEQDEYAQFIEQQRQKVHPLIRWLYSRKSVAAKYPEVVNRGATPLHDVDGIMYKYNPSDGTWIVDGIIDDRSAPSRPTLREGQMVENTEIIVKLEAARTGAPEGLVKQAIEGRLSTLAEFDEKRNQQVIRPERVEQTVFHLAETMEKGTVLSKQAIKDLLLIRARSEGLTSTELAALERNFDMLYGNSAKRLGDVARFSATLAKLEDGYTDVHLFRDGSLLGASDASFRRSMGEESDTRIIYVSRDTTRGESVKVGYLMESAYEETKNLPNAEQEFRMAFQRKFNDLMETDRNFRRAAEEVYQYLQQQGLLQGDMRLRFVDSCCKGSVNLLLEGVIRYHHPDAKLQSVLMYSDIEYFNADIATGAGVENIFKPLEFSHLDPATGSPVMRLRSSGDTLEVKEGEIPNAYGPAAEQVLSYLDELVVLQETAKEARRERRVEGRLLLPEEIGQVTPEEAATGRQIEGYEDVQEIEKEWEVMEVPGGVTATHPITRYRNPQTGEEVMVKSGPEHTTRADFIGQRFFALVGLPVPETSLVRDHADGSLKLVIEYIADARSSQRMPPRFYNDGTAQSAFVMDALINNYDRSPSNMVYTDNAVFFIDFGASFGSKARGGFTGFPENVDATQIETLLTDPISEGAINPAYANLLRVSNGRLVVRNPLIIEKSIERLQAITNEQIDAIIDEAYRDTPLYRRRQELRERIIALENRMRTSPDPQTRSALETTRRIAQEFDGDEAAYYKHAVKRRRDALAQLLRQALHESMEGTTMVEPDVTEFPEASEAIAG